MRVCRAIVWYSRKYRFVRLRLSRSLFQTASGRLFLTSEISHAQAINWNLIYPSLVINIVAISLKSRDHLFRAFDTWTRHFGWSWRSFSAVGVDDPALVGCHVHVLLTIAARDPTGKYMSVIDMGNAGSLDRLNTYALAQMHSSQAAKSGIV